MIRINRLTKRYGSFEALKGITLRVKQGEMFAYLGPNGAGKTTTIRILTGLTRPSSGEAWLNGFNIEKETLTAKQQCGMVSQSLNLDSELTVFENLDIHGLLFRMSYRDRRKRIHELLDYIGLSEKVNVPVSKLSGGLKRRLTIVRALMHSPKILFLDEPTVGLDASIRRRIWALIKKIQQRGTTIFLTTHYIEEAEFLAERVAFLDEGRIVAVDTPKSLMSKQGEWAIDMVMDDEMVTRYFRTKEEAKKYAEKQDVSFSLRRVNLEDAFLALTGKKVK